MSAAPGPALEGMLDWLGRLVRDHDGAVPSWINADHPGYPYPEAAGLLLTVLAQARPADPALWPCARWLSAQVDGEGLVGRRGLAHSFDTAIALTGLLAAERAGVAVDGALSRRMFEALLAAVEARRSVAVAGVEARWSTTWSCHQLKLAWALSIGLERCGTPGDRGRVEAALAGLRELLALQDPDGRFVINGEDRRSYVHASCYALEGLLGLRRAGWLSDAQLDDRLARGARWLAGLQGEDGSLPAWVDGPRDDRRRPSDVIAQALRIWSAVDRRGFAAEIDRALAALAARQVEGGGLRYAAAGPGARDLNSWSTAFAAQALSWSREGVDAEAWIA